MTQATYPKNNAGEKGNLVIMFRGDEKFLSNFWPCDVTLPEESIFVDGHEIDLPAMDFDSVEKAYMAWKTHDLETRRLIQTLDSGASKSTGTC